MVHPFINLLHLLVYSICWHGHPLSTPFLVLSVGLVHLYLICLFILCDMWYFCLIDSVSLFHLFLCWLDKVHLFVTFACLIHLLTWSICLLHLLVCSLTWYGTSFIPSTCLFHLLNGPSVYSSCFSHLLTRAFCLFHLFVCCNCMVQVFHYCCDTAVCLLQLYGSSVPLLLWYIWHSVCPFFACLFHLLVWYICF